MPRPRTPDDLSGRPATSAAPYWPDFRGLRVAVVGDLVADRYIYARPTRPSREAPVVVLREEGQEILPGGAANTARNVRSLGASVQLVGCLGRDDAARALLQRLGREGVGLAGVEVVGGWETPIKTRVMAGEHNRTLQQVLRLDREPSGPAPLERRLKLVERFLQLAGDVDAVIVSDYGYGMCGVGLAEAVARLRETSDVPVVLDPRQRFKSFRGVAAMTPNREDLARAVGRDSEELEDPSALARAAHVVLGEAGPGLLLVTLGKGGMALFGPGLPDTGLSLPAFGSQAVVDVTGAGDTAAATFALGLALGLSGPAAMVVANAAAGVVVMKLGAEVCSPEELGRALAALPPDVLPGVLRGELMPSGVVLPDGVGKLGLV